MNFTPYLNFLLYGFVALALLVVFLVVYKWMTPYNELEEIKAGNTAAAIAYGGAMLGFLFPILSALYFTHSIKEMIIWAFACGVLQLVTFLILHKMFGLGNCVQERRVAGATFLAFGSVSVGLINAFSISY